MSSGYYSYIAEYRLKTMWFVLGTTGVTRTVSSVRNS